MRLAQKDHCLARITYLILFMTFIIKPLSPTDIMASPSQIKVCFINVGQGDSILIQSGETNTLIDTGEEHQFVALKTYLQKNNVTTIHNLIITHPDSDHMGGADFLIDAFKVKKIYMTEYKNKTKEYTEMTNAVKRYHVKRVNVKGGQKINLGGLKADILSADSKADDNNNSSIVLKFTHKKHCFLLTGDISAKKETNLLRKYNINVDVLKVAHHGSAYSSGVLFLKKTSPQFSVISVGENNRYGHPVKTVLNRLKKYSKQTLRTDLNGTVVITSGHNTLTCETDKITSSAPMPPSHKPLIENTNSIIGNKNTKVYHKSSCRYLPAENNRIYFPSGAKAKNIGYRSCGWCH